MVDTSERIGSRLGGLVDRHAAAQRIAIRAAPLTPIGEPVDFGAVDRARGRIGRGPFVARAAIDAFRQLHPTRVDLQVEGRTIASADDHRLRALAELIGDPTTLTLTGGGATAELTIGAGRLAATDADLLERTRRILRERDWVAEL